MLLGLSESSSDTVTIDFEDDGDGLSGAVHDGNGPQASSPRTPRPSRRNHLSSAIGKTGTENRVEAARVASERGWI